MKLPQIPLEAFAKMASYAIAVGGTAVLTWTASKTYYRYHADKQVEEIRGYYQAKIHDLETAVTKPKKSKKASVDLREPVSPFGGIIKTDKPLPPYLEKAIAESTVTLTDEVRDALKEYGAVQVTTTARSFESRKPVPPPPNDRPLHPKSRPPIQLLTEEEFYAEDSDYPNQEKQSAVYYRGDDILTDQFDEVCDNYHALVGSDFLEEFGKHDPPRAFVRNTQLKMDWEINFEPGSYIDSLIHSADARAQYKQRRDV